jgi:copper oxidase (laccase) domain-containing protein
MALSPGLTTSDIQAWLGPAIGPSAFEVGEDVLQAFAQQGQEILSRAFIPVISAPGKYLADLYLLARDRLNTLGIEQITGGEFCTVSSPERFFSYRRDKVTGRFASLIWISKSA